VYGRHGFESVGLAEPLEKAAARLAGPGKGRAAYRFPAGRREGRAMLYPAWVVGADGGARPEGRQGLSALLAAAGLAGRQPLFLLLEPDGGPDADPAGSRPLLLPLLRALENRFQLEFLTLEEALAAERRRPGRRSARPPAADPPAAALPSVLEAAARAEALRARGPAPD
jgi:hypothetical protein